ncbi:MULTISPECIES: hypothetical protein [Candidatus Ichthyocystis]|uniref:hypothetical protein n=2 Tax=Burkholderiales genera incertae sedis TaxID=224471 RepID=UPI000B89AA50|nr:MULTISPECIES: hypothetical protein [Ichthyocystis]
MVPVISILRNDCVCSLENGDDSTVGNSRQEDQPLLTQQVRSSSSICSLASSLFTLSTLAISAVSLSEGAEAERTSNITTPATVTTGSATTLGTNTIRRNENKDITALKVVVILLLAIVAMVCAFLLIRVILRGTRPNNQVGAVQQEVPNDNVPGGRNQRGRPGEMIELREVRLEDVPEGVIEPREVQLEGVQEEIRRLVVNCTEGG